jgi:hypothetical protein
VALEDSPILALDTGVINQLVDDPNADALIAGLKSAFFV